MSRAVSNVPTMLNPPTTVTAGEDISRADYHRWMVEEFRVQCFAQTLGTAQKVSAKRLDASWDDLRRGG